MGTGPFVRCVTGPSPPGEGGGWTEDSCSIALPASLRFWRGTSPEPAKTLHRASARASRFRHLCRGCPHPNPSPGGRGAPIPAVPACRRAAPSSTMHCESVSHGNGPLERRGTGPSPFGRGVGVRVDGRQLFDRAVASFVALVAWCLARAHETRNAPSRIRACASRLRHLRRGCPHPNPPSRRERGSESAWTAPRGLHPFRRGPAGAHLTKIRPL